MRKIIGLVTLLLLVSNFGFMYQSHGDHYINISVEASADEEWRAAYRYDYDNKMFDLIEKADDSFYTNFHMNFIVDTYSSWDSNDYETDLGDALDEARSEQPNSENIILYFAGQDYPPNSDGTETLGVTDYAGADNAIIKDTRNFSDDWDTLRHEMTHQYGISHQSHPDYTTCIMQSGKEVHGWCKFCISVISDNRTLHGVR